MAECTNLELRRLREQQKLTRWQASAQIGVSQDTLRRWQTGQASPQPDDVDKLEKLYGAAGLWHSWMRSHYDSYRQRYPEMFKGDVSPVCRVRHQIDDVRSMQDRAQRDALDGRIDNPVTKRQYTKQLRDVVAAAISALASMDK